MMNLWWLKNFCFSFYYKKSETSKHDKSVLENKSSWLAEKWRNKHLISDFHTFTWLFLGGLIASDCFLIRIMAYSGIITNNRQTKEKKPSSPTHKSPKHKEDAGEHPGLYCCQTLSLGCVGGDGVEDVDQHQEQGDQERHPPWNDVRRNDETRRPGVLLLLSYQCFYLKVWEVCFCHK